VPAMSTSCVHNPQFFKGNQPDAKSKQILDTWCTTVIGPMGQNKSPCTDPRQTQMLSLNLCTAGGNHSPVPQPPQPSPPPPPPPGHKPKVCVANRTAWSSYELKDDKNNSLAPLMDPWCQSLFGNNPYQPCNGRARPNTFGNNGAGRNSFPLCILSDMQNNPETIPTIPPYPNDKKWYGIDKNSGQCVQQNDGEYARKEDCQVMQTKSWQCLLDPLIAETPSCRPIFAGDVVPDKNFPALPIYKTVDECNRWCLTEQQAPALPS